MTMRNRKNVIVAFVLVAVMLMAVGFAALSDNLVLDGEAIIGTSAANTAFDEDVYFSAYEINPATRPDRTADEVTFSNENDSATYKVNSLGIKGETVTFKFTIKNDSEDFDAKITIDGAATNNNTDAFDVEYFYGTADNASADNAVVPAGGTYDIFVKVTLKVEPSERLSGSFYMSYTATSQPKAANP